MKAVLDTSIVIGPSPETEEHQCAISVATLAELHFGVLVTTNDRVKAERLRRLAELERAFDPLPVDSPVAAAYGTLAARVASIGRQPRARVMDLLIAATALANDAAVLTRNPDDLAGIEDLVPIIAA